MSCSSRSIWKEKISNREREYSRYLLKRLLKHTFHSRKFPILFHFPYLHIFPFIHIYTYPLHNNFPTRSLPQIEENFSTKLDKSPKTFLLFPTNWILNLISLLVIVKRKRIYIYICFQNLLAKIAHSWWKNTQRVPTRGKERGGVSKVNDDKGLCSDVTGERIRITSPVPSLPLITRSLY